MAEFKVGGKCVGLVTGKSITHPPIKKGEVYDIDGIKKGPCGCSPILLDVGVRVPSILSPFLQCGECKAEFHSNGTWWIDSTMFAPLDELESQQAIDELLDKILESEKEKV